MGPTKEPIPEGAVSRAEWEAEGARLFGADKSKWAFRCPACGNVMSIERAMAECPEVKGKMWSVFQECIGRYTKNMGCDWCSYGLFHGPRSVVKPENNEVVFVFDFAAPGEAEKSTPVKTPAKVKRGRRSKHE